MEELKPLAKQGQSEEMEAAERMADLQRTVAMNVVDMLVQRFFEDYQDFPEVIQHMLAVRKDMVDNIDDLPARAAATRHAPARDPSLPVPRAIRSTCSSTAPTPSARPWSTSRTRRRSTSSAASRRKRVRRPHHATSR